MARKVGFKIASVAAHGSAAEMTEATETAVIKGSKDRSNNNCGTCVPLLQQTPSGTTNEVGGDVDCPGKTVRESYGRRVQQKLISNLKFDVPDKSSISNLRSQISEYLRATLCDAWLKPAMLYRIF